MLRKRTKYCLATLVAVIVTVFIPGTANAASFPDNRCLINFNCYINALDDHSIYLTQKVERGQCLRTHVPYRKYWNHTQFYQRAWRGGDCVGDMVVMAPGDYFNDIGIYFNAIGGYP